MGKTFLKIKAWNARRATPLLFFALAGVSLLAVSWVAYSQAPKPAAPAEVFNQYCVTCHNSRLKTAGLVIDPADLARINANPEVWEKVVRKLRSTAMPPAGSPRPDAKTYDATATFLETELDRASAANPNPGSLPLLHRLSRTEYQNSIRDLLALDALPKELDYSLLLPSDNISSGFDNIADLLFVSPSSMERYLDAAKKISSIAVGDSEMPLMVNIHKLGPEQLQDARVDELPFGTRGGLAIRSYFPLDADYNIKLETAGSSRDPNQIEVTIDGQRVQLISLGGPTGGRGGRGGRGAGGAADGASPLDFRIPVKAGPRVIGVTFIEQSQARDEDTLRPRMRSRGAQPAIASVTISGPFNVTGPGDTPSRKRIFACRPKSSADELTCARQILSTLTRRAYRRPSIDADIERLMPFYTAGKTEGGFDRGIQKALERVLVSPQFLFRIETDPASTAPGSTHHVSDLELASRLSFFLWSSIPDDELLNTAISGKLSNPATLELQAKRMMADPRSEAMVTNFAAQWLYLRDIQAKNPDEVLFPDFDETLRDAFHRETEMFLDSVLRENRSVLNLLTANYTFLNERLAEHYGIPNVKGSYFRRVELPENSPRAGLLGQGSILAVTSYANRTSPVLRGKWVLENLLSSAPPPPPPNVPALKTEGSEPGKNLTMRDAMIQHRANPACAGCHARMDPIGFSMENFDALGKWRDLDSFNKIDASGVLPDGTKFEGTTGLRKLLLDHSDEFISTVSEKLLMYAIGRNLQYYDAPSVRVIKREAARNGNTFASLVLGVVKSTPFQMRQTQK
jgi:mono/diheme cytochrome c family protein